MKKAISILLFIFFVLSFSACSSTDYSLTASNSESKAQSSLYWDDDYSYSQVDTDIEEQTEEPTKNPIDVEIEYKASCSTIDFKTLSRNPDKYIGNRYTFTGEVIQVMEESSSNTVHLRLDITKTSYGYSDTIYVVGELDNSGDRILEDDIITIWGDCGGLYSYESVLGSTVTLPRIDMRYYSINTQTESDDTTEKAIETTKKEKAESNNNQGIDNDTSSDNFYAYGDGDYVATGLKVTKYAVLHVDYYGSGHFSVTSYEGNEYDDLLVNTTGAYSGNVLVDHSGNFQLEIKASGKWNITSSGLSVDDTTSFSGFGDAVTGITSHSGGVWEITHSGNTGNFAVIEYGLNSGYMDLLVNEIGSYSGTVKAESGDNIFFKVSADGNWTIKKKE